MAKKTAKKKVAKKKVVKKVANKELSKTEREQNKQLIIFFAIMLILLGGFLAGYLYVRQLSQFSYAGVDFERGKAGEVVYYHGIVQMPATQQGGSRLRFNLFLRLDPRKNKVAINTDEFALSQHVTIAFDPEIGKCDKMVVAHSNMEQFFQSFPWVAVVSGASTNQSYAEERELAFANCESATPGRTIVMARVAEENSIEKEGNCYVLNVRNCEYLKVSERFIMGFVAKINNATI